MNNDIYAIWRSSARRLHIKDIKVNERFEDWWYGNGLDHSEPATWLDINQVHDQANDLMVKYEVKGNNYRVKDFNL